MEKLDISNPQVPDMIFMATYDLDRFRRFLAKTRVFEKIDAGTNREELVSRSEEELLRLGLDWIKFGLLGKKTLRVRKEVAEAAAAARAGGDPESGS